MPQRKSRKGKDQKSTITLRRSPRFLQLNPVEPKPQPKIIRASNLISAPTQTHEKIEEISQKREKERARAKISVKSSKGSKKSANNDIDLQKRDLIETRVTRNSVYQSKCVEIVEAEYNPEENCREKFRDLSSKGESKVSVNPPNQCLGNVKKKVTSGSSQTEVNVMGKRVTRSSVNGTNRVHYEEDEYDSKEDDSEEDCDERVSVLSKEEKGRFSDNLLEKSPININKRVLRSSSRTNVGYSGEGKLEGDIESSRQCENESGEKELGFNKVKKRKRDQDKKDCEAVGGWNDEQESALNRAYLTAKPTPQFWKKVAKMVPGKSAGECFERIQSDHMTPPQPCTRSRARTKSSPPSLSPTNLLSPANTKRKRLRSSKKSCLLAQRTVRQLLQKQQNENQDYVPDFFSILEPAVDLSSPNLQKSKVFSSPAPNRGLNLGSCVITRGREMSSSGHKIGKSRLNSSSNAAMVSPPVLKKIKNKALHEKYIDQLHYRDAKRKAELLRQGKSSGAKSSGAKNDNKSSSYLKANSVKVAKDSLIFEAQDAINKYRSLKLRMRNDSSDDDIDNPHDEDGDEDEDEDEV